MEYTEKDLHEWDKPAMQLDHFLFMYQKMTDIERAKSLRFLIDRIAVYNNEQYAWDIKQILKLNPEIMSSEELLANVELIAGTFFESRYIIETEDNT